MIKGDVVSKITAFEEGSMDEEEVLEFFREIIDSGLVWELQGHYGQIAMHLINSGLLIRR